MAAAEGEVPRPRTAGPEDPFPDTDVVRLVRLVPDPAADGPVEGVQRNNLVVVARQHLLSLFTRHIPGQLPDLVVVVDEEVGTALLHRVGDGVLDLGVVPVEGLVYQVSVP